MEVCFALLLVLAGSVVIREFHTDLIIHIMIDDWNQLYMMESFKLTGT